MAVSKTILSALTAVSLVALPTVASAAPAAGRLSIAKSVEAAPARAGATTSQSTALRGRRSGGAVIIGLGAIAAIVLAILIATRDSDSPRSA